MIILCTKILIKTSDILLRYRKNLNQYETTFTEEKELTVEVDQSVKYK